MINKEYMQRLIIQSGLDLPSELLDKLDLYARLLVEWNQRMNLTAITEPEDICIKHFLDSILPLKIHELPKNARVIDVGTGAGFPGVVMKLCRPDIELTLLDSLGKRVRFLEELCTQLKISARCIHMRAEDGARFIKISRSNDSMQEESLRESFDLAVARAVAPLAVLCEYLLPYVRVGGTMMSLKGTAVYDEVKPAAQACRILGGERARLLDYSLFSGNTDDEKNDNSGKRVLVLVKKISHTPTRFPRNSAQIAKRPL